MRVGMVGLGRMGGGMSLRLLRHGHEVVAFDPDPEARARAGGAGAMAVGSLEELVGAVEPPRVVWLMVPAGAATGEAVDRLGGLLGPGDVLVDGGNSYWKDSVERAARLAERGVRFLDCGTSGGVWGPEQGYCLMVGGDPEAYALVEPLLRALAADGGYLRVGPSGAGHFVKMVHNGIEYGLLAAYGEGFELLASSRFDLDLAALAELWRHGSVIRSFLLDLLADALRKDPELATVRGYVEDSGEGRWTVQTAVEEGVPVPVTALSLFARFASRQEESFAAKVIAALRREFGGHPVVPARPRAGAGPEGDREG
ncbi:MAG TPA: decarboxylating 6-phosphogluconate dehydrogenase [Actinomycetota bacterium]|nr:decarboxylating 6-phosphogluconate dehydrogenase [Actinomycetota bacterium]